MQSIPTKNTTLMKGGRKLKAISGNSVVYLIYKYILLTTFLPLGKKVVFYI
jgi:hypothetical protein